MSRGELREGGAAKGRTVYAAQPSSSTSTSIWPRACAPSTTTGTEPISSQKRLTGRMTAGTEVMWERIAARKAEAPPCSARVSLTAASTASCDLKPVGSISTQTSSTAWILTRYASTLCTMPYAQFR